MRKKHDNIRLYHVDHFGSTSLVTDIDGEITQHVAYIPYGEIFVEQRNGSWNTPYLFNAKELDEETGLYYYGARYLDPTHAAWLSVDPMFEKYVGMTPYGYCAGNPVGLVDVDGLSLKVGIEEIDYTGYADPEEYSDNLYIKNTIIALNEKYQNGDADIITAINSDEEYKIKPNSAKKGADTEFSSSDQTIYWDWDRKKIYFGSGDNTNGQKVTIIHSPAALLSHEFSHLEDFDKFIHGDFSNVREDLMDLIESTDRNSLKSYYNGGYKSGLFKNQHGEGKAMQMEHKKGHELGEFFSGYSRPWSIYEKNNDLYKWMPTNSVFLNKKDKRTNKKSK